MDKPVDRVRREKALADRRSHCPYRRRRDKDRSWADGVDRAQTRCQPDERPLWQADRQRPHWPDSWKQCLANPVWAEFGRPSAANIWCHDHPLYPLSSSSSFRIYASHRATTRPMNLAHNESDDDGDDDYDDAVDDDHHWHRHHRDR